MRDNAAEKSAEEMQMFIDNAARKFMNTELGLGIQAAGIDLIRDDAKSNYERSHKMYMGQAKTHEDMELTIMGRGVYGTRSTQPKGNTDVHYNQYDTAQKQMRLYSKNAKKYLNHIAPLTTWSYWQEKAWAGRDDPKAANNVAGLLETLVGFAKGDPSGYRAHVDPKEFDKYRDSMLAVLEDWNSRLMTLPDITIEKKQSWYPFMNWGRNAAHPLHFSVPQERFDTIDWPNFRDFLTRGTKILDPELIAEFMDDNPLGMTNANHNIYTMFTRSPDRVIHGIRLLMKPYGAIMTGIMTPGLRNSDVSWTSVEQMQFEAAEALADATVISADDLKKFDKSLHPRWFTLIYECVIESGFLSHSPEHRAILLILLYDLTRETNRLRVHGSWLMEMYGGLPSGHGLTQWIGSLVHLTLYKFWADKYSLNPTWQKVLSDDGIQIYNDVSPTEMAKIHVLMGEDLEKLGMQLHPDKTKIADPTNELYVGQINGESAYMIESTYFLKRNLQRDVAICSGNPAGVVPALLQTERSPTDKALQEAAVRSHIIGLEDMTLGNGPPRAIYDLARTVDVLASCGPGNLMVEDHINFIQNTWPGFNKRGRSILLDNLDDSWQAGTTSYAGGTLDSGLSRQWAVEALLDDSDGYKIWDEVVYRNT